MSYEWILLAPVKQMLPVSPIAMKIESKGNQVGQAGVQISNDPSRFFFLSTCTSGTSLGIVEMIEGGHLYYKRVVLHYYNGLS